jgi:hypothetical protein
MHRTLGARQAMKKAPGCTGAETKDGHTMDKLILAPDTEIDTPPADTSFDSVDAQAAREGAALERLRQLRPAKRRHGEAITLAIELQRHFAHVHILDAKRRGVSR